MTINITLNGAPTGIAADRLDAALAELGYGGARVATALNEAFVPAALRAGTALKDGDRLEVLAPMQGG